jgi:ERCC4-type nuclease
MVFTLTVDGREPPVIFAAFDANNIPYTRINMDVGDFEVASDTVVAIIAERKTWSDLCGSLTSSRLAEQTSRILEKCKSTGARPLLIIEHPKVCSWEGQSGGLSNKFIDCCLLKYSLEGFSVIRTVDATHTRDVVSWLMKRCNDGKVPSFIPTLNFKEQAGNQKFRKKDYTGTPWQLMLTAIRGVSKAKAKDIVARYATARELVKHFEETGAKMNVPGIGKVLEASIRQALLGN